MNSCVKNVIVKIMFEESPVWLGMFINGSVENKT